MIRDARVQIPGIADIDQYISNAGSIVCNREGSVPYVSGEKYPRTQPTGGTDSAGIKIPEMIEREPDHLQHGHDLPGTPGRVPRKEGPAGYSPDPGVVSNRFWYSMLKSAIYSPAARVETQLVFSPSATVVKYPFAFRNSRYSCPVFELRSHRLMMAVKPRGVLQYMRISP
jgi:hypothetical protein